MSQLQYTNKDQNFISNFVFKFIKQTKNKNEMVPEVNGLF